MTPEYDEYGVLIKRPTGKPDVDEYGIPRKKKASGDVSTSGSGTTTTSTSDFDKIRSFVTGKTAEQRQQQKATEAKRPVQNNIDPAKYETRLSPQEEIKFQSWLDNNYKSGRLQKGDYDFYKKNGYGLDYDFRAAFKAGENSSINASDSEFHWSDIGKKPNHPTFSVESKYNNADGHIGGTWDGETFIPPPRQSIVIKDALVASQPITPKKVDEAANKKLQQLDEFDDYEDPVKGIDKLSEGIPSAIDIAASNKAKEILIDRIAPDGFEAKQKLELTHLGNAGNDNFTSRILAEKADKYDKATAPVREIEIEEDPATVDKSLLDFKYTPRLRTAALKYAVANDPSFANELKAAGFDIDDPFLDSKLPSGKMGQKMEEFISDPNIRTYLKKENPALIPAFDRAIETIRTDNKDYGINRVANEVSKAMQETGYNNIDPVFNFDNDVSRGFANDVAQRMYANDPRSLEIYNQHIRDNQSEYLDRPSLFEGIGTAGKHFAQGLANTFGLTSTDPKKAESEMQKDVWDKEMQNVSADPKGFSKFLRDSGTAIGTVASIAATGNVLGGAGLTSSAANTTAIGVGFLGDNLEQGFAKYPGEPVKAWTSALVNTGIYMAMGARVFPAAKVKQAFEGIRPEVNQIIENLTSGNITREAARKKAASLVKDGIELLGGSLSKSAKIGAELTGATILNQMLDKVMGADDKWHPEGEAWDTFKTMTLSNLFIGGLGKYGEMRKGNKIVEESLYEAASNPLRYKRVIDELKADPTVNKRELLSNLEYLSETKKQLDEIGIEPKAQKRFLFESMRSKAQKENVAKSPSDTTTRDSTMTRMANDEIKRSDEIKERILKGEDPENIVPEADQKIIDEAEETKLEVERLTKKNELDNKEFEGKRKELDGRIPDDRIKIERLEQQIKEKNEDFERSINKIYPKEKKTEEPKSHVPAIEAGAEISDTDHAAFIRDKFVKQFSDKGVPKEQVQAAVAIMDARAKIASPENPDKWYRQIEDIGNGEFQGEDVKFQGEWKKMLVAAAIAMQPLKSEHISTVRVGDRTIKVEKATPTEKDHIAKFVKDYFGENTENAPQEVIDRAIHLWEVYGKPSIHLDSAADYRAYTIGESKGKVELRDITNFDDYIAEISHAAQFFSGAKMDIKEYATQRERDSLEYNRKGSSEYDAHKIIEPYLANYVFEGKTGGDLINFTTENATAKQKKDILNTLKKYNVKFQGNKGALETLENGKKIIHALNAPDFSTAVHEIAHVFETELTQKDKGIVAQWSKQEEWNIKTSEMFATGFEKYLKEGKSPTPELKSIFQKAKEWLNEIYNSLRNGFSVKLTPEVRKVFDNLFVKNETSINKEPTRPTEQIPAEEKTGAEGTPIETIPATETAAGIEGEKRTGIKNAVSEATRGVLELPKVEVPKYGSDSKVIQEGKELVDSGTIEPTEVVNRINSTDNHNMSRDEAKAMQYYMHQLGAHESEIRAELAATEDPVTKADYVGLLGQLSDLQDAATAANIKSGKDWSDVGNIRQVLVDQSFNPSREKAVIKEAYGGEIPKDAKLKIDEALKQRDEAVAERTKLEEQLRQKEAALKAAQMSKEAKKEPKAKGGTLKERVGSLIEELKAANEKQNQYLKDQGIQKSGIGFNLTSEMIKIIGKIGVEVAKEGYKTIDEFITKVYEQVKDHLPGSTKKDIRDAIAMWEAEKLDTKAGKLEDKITPPLLDKNGKPVEPAPIEDKPPKLKLKFQTNTEWVKANQRVANAEHKIAVQKRLAFESKKNMFQKGLMWAGRLTRLSVLSGYNVLGKLAAAATVGAAAKRIPEQVIGRVYQTVFKGISEKAPIEGYINAKSEAKFYKEFFNPKKFVKNSWEILKTGESDLNKRFGGGGYEHVPVLYLPTDLHQVIKDPVKRATFEASFRNSMIWAEKNGLDITDPLVIHSLETAAYKRGSYEIFQESNWLSRKFSAFKSKMEDAGNVGAVGKFIADFMIPVSTVPTNIVRRLVTTSPLGLIRGSKMVVDAYRKGIENLEPEQADAVMKQLKQGSLGTALWLIGWFGAASYGGLYSKYNPNKERDEGDLASDEMEVNGKMIPKPVQHALPLEIIQWAATARHIYDNYRENKGASTFESIYNAGMGSIGALAEQIPVIETAAHVAGAFGNPYEAAKLEEDVKRRFQPQILRETGIIKKEEKKSTNTHKTNYKKTSKRTKQN